MAPVGQAGMHAVQAPQDFVDGRSGGRSRSVITCPRKTQEPMEVRTLVFLPKKPTPARHATSRSSMGPSST